MVWKMILLPKTRFAEIEVILRSLPPFLDLDSGKVEYVP